MVAEDLEAALRHGWSFGDLEVYADHLLSLNDPRGHVVAIDLVPRPALQHWRERRHAALVAWLGNSLAASAGHLIQHGFLHELRDGAYPADLLDSPAATYLRGYTTFGSTRCRASLVRLGQRPRPWLVRLVIANHDAQRCTQAELAALIAATPRLEELWVLGAPMFDAFPHPGVRRVHAGTACAAIEFPAAAHVAHVEAPAFASGPTVSAKDLELVMELVELAPDCNALYTYGAELADLPALVARLAAAKLVELDGPIVRAATSQYVARQQVANHQPVSVRQGYIEAHPGHVQIQAFDLHVRFLHACLATYPIAARTRDVIEAYLGAWSREPHHVPGARMSQFQDAFNALLELRGLFAEVRVPDDTQWELAERLGQPFDGGNGGVFQQWGW